MSLRTPLRKISSTIGFRIAAVYSVVFIFSFLALSQIAYLFLASTLSTRDREQVLVEVRNLSDQYRAGGLSLFEQTVLNNDRFRKNNPFFTRIIDNSGQGIRVFFPQYWQEFDLSRLDILAIGARTDWLSLPSESGQTLEVYTTSMPDGFDFQVGISSGERSLVLERFKETFLFVTLPLLVFVVAGGSIISQRILSPLRGLIQTVGEINAGRLEARVSRSQSGDELDELGRLFNEMTDQIQALIRGMKEALDNVAHDLRTPMTRFRNMAETALEVNASPQSTREALQDCVEESDRILRMLGMLMDISEAETGTLRLHRQEVDLAELMDAVADLYQYVAEEKGVSLTTQFGCQVRLDLDPERISQALANLLDNAVKYTPPGGLVRLSLLSAPGKVLLQVEDDGIGLEPAEIDRIWDRLYRGRHAGQKGTGLGLSLVRAIVQAHGGKVTARASESGGALFEIELTDPTTPMIQPQPPPQTEDRLGSKT